MLQLLLLSHSNHLNLSIHSYLCIHIHTIDICCGLFADPLSVPSLTVDSVTNSAVEYRVQRIDDTTDAVITGYDVIRFGVPMKGQYVNTGRRRRVTISLAVPGAQYRIAAWALGDGRRSATPAVVDATTREAGECGKHGVHYCNYAFI